MASNSNLMAIYLDLKRRIEEIDLRQGGPQGPRGKKGDTGPQGKTGPQGPTGKTGPAGATGARGPTGPAGKAGPSGRDGSDGLPGVAGRDGVDGADGRDGEDGVSITDVSIDFDGHLTVFLSDGREVDAGALPIAEGEGGTIIYTGGSGGSGTGGGGDVPPHNGLTGLQGNGPEYYHLNQAEFDTVINWINNGIPAADLPVFAGAGAPGIVPDPVTETGLVLSDNGTWVPQSGGGSGEANTTSNQGAGEGLALPKVGVDLPFKSLVAGANVTLTPGADTVEIAAAAGGQVDSVTGLDEITVDNTDPANPVVSWAALLGDLDDVDTTGADDGERLAYDSISGLWVPRRSTSALGIVALSYRWSTPPSTTPAAGRVTTDNVDPTLVTIVYVNEIDDAGRDNSIYFDNIGEGDWLNIIDRQDDTNTNQYDVTGPPVLTAGVYAVPVVYFGSNGPNFANNEQVAVFIRYTSAGVTDHTDLTSIGVNTHDQIDTHIASTANPHGTTVANLTDTTITAPAADEVLTWDGAAWVNAAVPPPTLPANVVTGTPDGIKLEIVATLPGTPDEDTIYFITGP